MTAIARVETWACGFDLPRPIRVGGLVVSRRDYTVVRVTTADGVSGVAYALTRGAPVDLLVADLLAPVALGHDAADIADVMDRCSRAVIALGREGLLQRALALLDIALWDVEAKRRGVPLFRLLGDAERTCVDVLLVEGYPREGEGSDAFAARLAARASEGHQALKLANLSSADEMTERLARTREAVGETGLVVDVAWAWRDVPEAVETSAGWEQFGLAWIEDPFPARELDAIVQLKAAVHTPIAVGDEMTSELTAADLIARNAVDLLRVDATAIGGISGFAAVRARAAAAGLRISPHVHPEIHQHCAFAWSEVCHVEVMGGEGEFDCTDLFVARDALRRDGGVVRPPERPGLGCDFDWDAVKAHSIRALARTRA